MRSRADCHPNRLLAARGLCGTCYMAARRAGTAGEHPPTYLMPDALPQCDVCAIETGAIVRFNLVHSVMVNGKKTTRGAGGIEMCERCWKMLRRGHARKLRAAA